MPGFVLRRIAASALLVWLVLSASFFLVHLAPGEPARLYENPRMSEELRETIRANLGLDRPLVERYGLWLAAMLRGDWGTSFQHSRPALSVLLDRLPATALLVLAALLIEHLVGVPLGIVAARHQGRRLDDLIRWLSLIGHSLPTFLLALVAIELFAVRLPVFPSQHMTSAGAQQLPWLPRLLDLLHHLALPALTLGLVRCAAVIRFVRNGMLDVLSQDFVRAARARGLPSSRVLFVHALPNALSPLIQRLGVALPLLLSGSVVMEVIFAWPGIGVTAYRAVLGRDYPVVLAATAMTALLVVAGSLVADLAHAWLDPRVRDARA